MPFQSKGWVPPSDEEIETQRSRIEDKQEESFAKIPAALQKQLAAATAAPTTLVKDIRALLDGDPVDIVMPIHNGMHIVQDVLNKLIERTVYPYVLTLVDDGSDDYTKSWLKEWADTQCRKGIVPVRLITNKKNKGFAATCNVGARAGSASLVCFLNSDVIVTEGWLTKMVRAMLSDDRNAIVNPATNNTALVGIKMAPGMSYLDMNAMLERRQPTYPVIMPTGFCYFIRRKVLEQVGMFDEAFVSYGEESDLWMRALKCVDKDTGEFMQYRSVMADDTYVYHQRGTSFSVNDEDTWMQIRKRGSNRFHNLHPDYRRIWRMEQETNERLEGLRTTEVMGFRDELRQKPLNITWLVHSTAYCGGMKFIADIVNQLQEEGINATVTQVCRPGCEPGDCLGELRSGRYVYADTPACVEKFGQEVFTEGIVVPATGELAPIAAEICKKHPRLQALNHLQSWDIGHVKDSETINALENLYRAFHHTITNAYWLTEKLQELGVKNVYTASPGVEKNLWYPKNRNEGDDRPTVLIHLSEQYPFRGYERGVETAKCLVQLAKEVNKDIRIIGIGCHKVVGVPEVTCYPLMAPTRLAKFIGTEVDLVLDPSLLHSYGLPCLEAIASGVEIASWDNKGIHEYGNEEYDIILDADAPPSEMAVAIFHKLQQPRCKDLGDTCYPSREEGVNQFISCLKDIYKYGANKEKKLVFVTPHVRKFGGPHTIIDTANLMQKIGYDVTVAVVHADSVNLELTGECKVPLVFGLENIPKCDIIFVPSDSDKHEEIKTLQLGRNEHCLYPKRVLLKLGHNQRFQKLEEDGLNGAYNKVITSTQWLKDVTENGSEGWTYQTQPATKVGWYNYGFRQFNTPPETRSYHKFKGAQVVIAGLVHQHPLKGTKELVNIFKTLHERHGNLVKLVGVGEVPAQNRTNWMTYIQSPSRSGIHEMFSQVDIWVNCSHTEGLGRMSLEAMSSGCAVVATDTGCEYMEQKVNSLIFPIGDVKKGVYMVEKILNNENLMTDLVMAGYETARRYSDPVEYATQLEKVVKELV